MTGEILILMHEKKYEEAFECYNQAINLDKEYVKAWYRLGYLSFNFGRWYKSIECFEKVIELERHKDPDEAIFINVANFLYMMACINLWNSCVLNKKSIPDEIKQKTEYQENLIRSWFERLKITPKFNNETEFVDFCVKNFDILLDKLEPKLDGLFLRGKETQFNIQYGKLEDLKERGFKID